jgi:hypothetical protein
VSAPADGEHDRADDGHRPGSRRRPDGHARVLVWNGLVGVVDVGRAASPEPRLHKEADPPRRERRTRAARR